MSNPKSYAVLTEVHGGLDHTFYYFIKYQGNEKQLRFLQEQLEKIEEMCIYGDDSMFFLDLENLVSETTAKEMCMVDTGDYYHRKFDGTMKQIDFHFSRRDDDEDKLDKVNQLLIEGGIADFVSNEDTFGRPLESFSDHEKDEDSKQYDDDDDDKKKDEIESLRKRLEKLEKKK